MKKIKLFLIAIIGLSLLFSCKKEADVKIGFLMPASVGYRWPIDERYVKEAAQKLGVEVKALSAENDENLQLKQAEQLLDEGVDVLIVVPANANTAAAIVRDAHEYNVPVIGYDRLIKNSDLDYLVTFEGAKIGSLMVEHAIQKVPKGNYVMLWGDASDVNAIQIKEEQERILQPLIDRGDINIVYKTFVENWSRDNAYHTMKRVLDFSDQEIDAVITSYDGLAVGALDALHETNRKPFEVLTGQDAEIDAIKSINNDEMSMTVYKSIKTIANASVDLAVKLARGQKIEKAEKTINNGRRDVPLLLLDPIPVTKSTVRSTIISDGFYTEEEVYGK